MGRWGRSKRATSARRTAWAVRPRPRGHGRRGKHVRLATAAPSGVRTGGWGTTGTPRTAGRPLRSGRQRATTMSRARGHDVDHDAADLLSRLDVPVLHAPGVAG